MDLILKYSSKQPNHVPAKLAFEFDRYRLPDSFSHSPHEYWKAVQEQYAYFLDAAERTSGVRAVVDKMASGKQIDYLCCRFVKAKKTKASGSASSTSSKCSLEGK